MNKAVVREFPDVAPDAQGNIVIRIAATPDSPDQNAKISGVEILKSGAVDLADASNSFTIKTADGKSEITFDTTAAPELKDWAADKLAPVLAEWYPKIVVLLPSEGFVAPTHFKIIIKPMDGVAYTVGTDVMANSTWLKSEIHGEAVGALVHEAVHVVQQYGLAQRNNPEATRSPGWLVEGMADYVRWFKYEPQSHGADIVWMRKLKHFSPRYDASYRVSANFLNWLTENYDQNIVTQLNEAMREGRYSDGLWEKYTGKTVQELGATWKTNIETQLAISNPSKNAS